MGPVLATLKDISQKKGLSVATVSRALNGFPEVNARTRALVEETARQLNYSPNRLAQKLVSGRSGMVGMLVCGGTDLTSDRSFIEIMIGLSSRLAERDIDLVFQVGQGDDPVAPYRKLIDKNTLDGFILNAPRVDDTRISFLQEQGVPFVVHGRDSDDPAYAFYDIDNPAVAAQSVQLLTDLGHRRIALINGDAEFAFAGQRLAGFRAAMADRRLTAPPEFIFHGLPSEDYGYTSALAALSGRLGARPTAIVCASTLIAAGVMKAARDLSLEVPGDLSIMAHDDALPELRAINFQPSLTVTRAPLRESCVPLADKLIDLLAGVPVERLQTTVPAELIIRDSTGPAPSQETAAWT